MRHTIRRVSVFALALALSGFLGAQVPSQMKSVGKIFVEDLDKLVQCLSHHYFKGDWDILQAKLSKLLPGIVINGHEVNPKSHFYFVVFPSQPINDDPKLIRIPWRDPSPEPYSMRISGEKEIFEIILGAGSNLTLESSYSSSELEDPLLAQIPAFVKTIEPALAAIIKTTGLRSRAPSSTPSNVELRSIVLPFRRAKIGIKDIAVLSDASLMDSVKKMADELNDSIKKRIAYLSEFGKSLSDSINTSITMVTQPAPGTLLSETMAEAVHKAYLCHFNPDLKFSKDELNLAISIENEYADLIDALAEKKVEAESSYENAPLAHVSFGLISAFFFENSFTKKRAKLTDDGFFAADPAGLPLTAAVVNYHPSKYDPQSARLTAAEAFRLFGGIVLTPDAGFCAGASLSPLRGLSFNAGAAFLTSRTAFNAKSVTVDGKEKTKPADPGDPFQTRWGFVLFLGLGYNFK